MQWAYSIDKIRVLRPEYLVPSHTTAVIGIELVSHVFLLNHEGVREVRLRALKSLAAEQISSCSANGRNYYLTIALEDHKLIETTSTSKVRATGIKNMRMKTLLKIMATHSKPEEVEGIIMTLIFNLTDTNESYTCYLRNSILEVVDGATEKWDLQITTTSETWKDIYILGQFRTYLQFRGRKYLNTFIVTNANDCPNILSHGATFRMGVLVPNYPEENVVKQGDKETGT